MKWLLLRGLMREQRHWMNFPQVFASTLGIPQEDVLCLDLPGVGTEHKRSSPATITGIAQHLRKRFTELAKTQPNQPWAVFSISLGSMVALDWLQRYPKDFSKAVVVNTSARNVAFPWERMRYENLGRALSIPFVKDPLLREQAIFDLTTQNLLKTRESTVQKWAQFAVDAPVSIATASSQLLAAMQFSAPQNVCVPLLILSSAQDQLVNPVCSARLSRRYSRSRHVVHPAAGHDICLDDPLWVSERVREWIASSF